MKSLFTLIGIFLGVLGYTQNAKYSLDSLLNYQITDDIKVVGLGSVSAYPSKESANYSLEISKYLIKNKDFKHIFIGTTDIVLRSFNDYINDDSPYKKEKFDSLIKEVSAQSSEYTFLNTPIFSDLIYFLKEYNLKNPNKKVSLYGTVYASPLPLYFINKYVAPLDKSENKNVTKKWIELDIQNASEFCKEIIKWYDENINTINRLTKNQYYKNLMKDVNLARTFINIEAVQYNESQTATLIYQNLSNDILSLEGKSIIWERNHFLVKSFKREKAPKTSFLGHFLSNALKDKYYSIIFDFSKKVEFYIHKEGNTTPITQEFIPDKDATTK